MFIRSERLFLRPGWAEDRDELAMLHSGCAPACAPWFDAAVDLANPRPPAGLPRFVITVPGPEGARMVGLAALEPAAEGVRIAIWIGPAHRGRGYAPEAADALRGLALALGHRLPPAAAARARRACACDDDSTPTLRAA